MVWKVDLSLLIFRCLIRFRHKTLKWEEWTKSWQVFIRMWQFCSFPVEAWPYFKNMAYPEIEYSSERYREFLSQSIINPSSAALTLSITIPMSWLVTLKLLSSSWDGLDTVTSCFHWIRSELMFCWWMYPQVSSALGHVNENGTEAVCRLSCMSLHWLPKMIH